jgi:V/A-type H+/Na+-transporting ATPase subunit D
MADIKLTKSGLRSWQIKLKQLEKYLPTLKLKKTMLQMEVNLCSFAIEEKRKAYFEKLKQVERFESVITLRDDGNILNYIEKEKTEKTVENIAGIDLPTFKEVIFKDESYSLFDTPIWFDSALKKIKELISLNENILVLQEKRKILKKELNDVSIRVNLFEKILIPRTHSNIKKIKIFLGDQELASVAQAKVAKTKILAKKKMQILDEANL